MQRILRIRHWETHFETSETRKLKHLRWVPLSNNQNDPGYARLMRRADGPQLLAAWIGMLQAASRCKVRGTFLEGDGTPYDAESIAAVCQMPVDLISKAIDVFTSEIKWLEWVTKNPPEVPGDFRRNAAANGTEHEWKGNRTIDHVDVSSIEEPIRDSTGSAGPHDARKIASVTRPKTHEDRRFIGKVCVLLAAGPISQNAIWDAFEAVRVKAAELRKPIAYFREVLAANARKENHDLGKLLAGVRAPPELMAALLLTPEPRLCSAESD